MEFEEKKEPNLNCECAKQKMSKDDIILQRLKQLEKNPESAIPWKNIKRN